MTDLGASVGWALLFAAVALELVPEADAEAGPALTAAGLAAGTLAYVGADAWLNREPSTRDIRRSAHAAASGRAMTMPRDHAQAARGESIATAQAVAAGAVLAVISIAIVPHAFAEASSRVATATVAGFIAGYLLS